MQKLKQIYRSNYAGESIVTELVLEKNEWNPVTEYVPNSVFTTHTTRQAVSIGNGPSRQEFDLTHIANHKGGLFASNKLQSYGCNYLYQEFTPDFLVAVDTEKVKTIANSGYTADNIVYTNAQYMLEYPGKFYLTPQNPAYDAGALAAYMACFDGHSKVFLLGYDGYTNAPEHVFWVNTLLSVMKTYSAVDFVRVMPTAKYIVADALQRQPNFRQIGFRDFVIEADIG
jgi:hypothetical protein